MEQPKTKWGNVIALLIPLCGMLALCTVFSLKVVENGDWFGYLLLPFPFLLLVFFVRRYLPKPTFVKFRNGYMEYRSFVYIDRRKIPVSEIESYVSSWMNFRTKHSDTNYRTYVLNLRNGKTLELVQYNFTNFEQFPQLFRANGIQKKREEKATAFED